MVKFVFLLCTTEKHRKYLQRCLSCIKDQTYQNWEVVLYFDDGGEMEQPVKDSRITYIADGKKLGHCARLNMGLDRYKNQQVYINFHGVDDHLVKENVLEIVNEKLTAGRNKWEEYPGWLYGAHIVLGEGDKDALGLKVQKWDYKRLKKWCYIAGGAVFAKRDLYGNFRFRDLAFGHGNDWDMWMNFGTIEEPMVVGDWLYVESIGTSSIRKPFTSIKYKLEKKIKYKVWNIQRRFG